MAAVPESNNLTPLAEGIVQSAVHVVSRQREAGIRVIATGTCGEDPSIPLDRYRVSTKITVIAERRYDFAAASERSIKLTVSVVSRQCKA